jgi:hypothetical protein
MKHTESKLGLVYGAQEFIEVFGWTEEQIKAYQLLKEANLKLCWQSCCDK